MDEPDRSGMEEQSAEMELDPETSVEFHVAVQGIHHHGTTDLREMLADLVASPSFDLGLHDGTRNAEQVEMPQDMEKRPSRDQLLGLAGLKGFRDLAPLRDPLQQSDIFFGSGWSRQNRLELGSVLGIFSEQKDS